MSVPNVLKTALPRLKYCGFTRREDVLAAIDVGVHAIGLNFFPKSKRYIPLDVAEELSRCAEGQAMRVGIFVDASPRVVEQTVLACGLDLVQLHGDETVAWVSEASDLPGLRGVGILRAMAYRGAIDDPEVMAWAHLASTDPRRVRGILVDAYDPVERGGTGRTARWDLLHPRPQSFACRAADLDVPKGMERCVPMMLAGGITAENVEHAMGIARPDGVDVASGIESAPGIKDRVLMRRIAEHVHRFYERVG